MGTKGKHGLLICVSLHKTTKGFSILRAKLDVDDDNNNNNNNNINNNNNEIFNFSLTLHSNIQQNIF